MVSFVLCNLSNTTFSCNCWDEKNQENLCNILEFLSFSLRTTLLLQVSILR